MSKRSFEVIKAYQDKAIHLPKRATKNAAGYDFEAGEDVVIPAIWKQVIAHFTKGAEASEKIVKPVLVPTGIKAYMGEDEYLQLANRSSNPLKRFITLSNGIGVIDSDYRGEIRVGLCDLGQEPYTVQPGERIAQLVISPVLLPPVEEANELDSTERGTGGFGSTGKR